MSSVFDDRLNLQSLRLDTVSESTQQAHKVAQDNAEVLNTLLVGMENLGDNVKQLREEMNTWGQPDDQEVLDELVKEVPMASEPPQVSNQSPVAMTSVPPVSVSLSAPSVPVSGMPSRSGEN